MVSSQNTLNKSKDPQMQVLVDSLFKHIHCRKPCDVCNHLEKINRRIVNRAIDNLNASLIFKAKPKAVYDYKGYSHLNTPNTVMSTILPQTPSSLLTDNSSSYQNVNGGNLLYMNPRIKIIKSSRDLAKIYCQNKTTMKNNFMPLAPNEKYPPTTPQVHRLNYLNYYPNNKSGLLNTNYKTDSLNGFGHKANRSFDCNDLFENESITKLNSFTNCQSATSTTTDGATVLSEASHFSSSKQPGINAPSYSSSQPNSNQNSNELFDNSKINSNETEKSKNTCNFCGKQFGSWRQLIRHKNLHSNIRRFVCKFCAKGFNDAFDLKRHTRTHTGIRPYKCDRCPKSFTQRCSLEAHSSKVHNIQLNYQFRERRPKLFVCEMCGKTFKDSLEHKSHATEHNMSKLIFD